MKKYLKIIILLVITSMFFTACNKKTDQDQQPAQNDTQESSVKGNLKDLLGMGKNIKCTFSDEQDGVSLDIETYISGNKVRTTTTQKSPDNETFVYDTIMDDTWVYNWDSMGNAYKMNLKEMEELAQKYSENDESADTSTEMPAVEDIQKEFDYKCNPWVPDNSKFQVPSNINFIDQGEIMEETIQQTEEIKENLQDMCSMCNNMPDEESKNACLENLGCN